MRVLGVIYIYTIESIGLTHFATASATVFCIYTEVKWSFIRPIDSHTMKTAPLKMHWFIFIIYVYMCFIIVLDGCCCSHFLSPRSLFVFLCLLCCSFHPGNVVFGQTATMQRDTLFSKQHWTLANTWKPCWILQCSVFPALVQAALPTSGVHLECKGIHM